jgi:hypothetical protein
MGRIIMRRLFALVISLMLVGVQVPAGLAQEEATPAGSPTMNEYLDQIRMNQTCAWAVELDVGTFNVAFPDANSFYFVMPYVLSPGQSFVVDGAYPIARFSSVVTYYRDLASNTGLELLGWLPDLAIVPDEGSANPALDPEASDDPAARQWTIRVTGEAPASASPIPATPVAGENILPAMPVGMPDAIGVLTIRIYVPQDASDHTGGVGLPAVTLEEADGTSRQITECTAADRETWKGFFTPFVTMIIEAAPQLPMPPSADARPEWVQTTFPGLGTNPDNRYLVTPIAWEPGRIVVFRAKAPTFPDTRAGDPPTMPADLRYWSFCTGSNVIPLVTASCVADFQMPIAEDGTFTAVVSQPEDRPANATEEEGVGWLQGGAADQPDLLYLRHMLPSQEFMPQSAWAVPEGVVGAPAEIMGPYYPEITYCDVATFEAGGADACFAQAEATPTN